MDQSNGQAVSTWWDDVLPVVSWSDEKEGYPTQKPSELLRRIIQASSAPGDLVLDCFAGSGTTAAVAQDLGRRWIACDINKGSVQTAAKRLQTIMRQQETARLAESNPQGQLHLVHTVDTDRPPPPAQLSFTHWRVNDYDLQIQHNEAVELVSRHVGVERVRSDTFFDGTRGSQLVKIIPFNHPLSPLDLDEIRRELDTRPDEQRGVLVICLGQDLATMPWLDAWNRLRSGDHAVNRIDVIELRTDPKYGRFIEHQPASADVSVERDNEILRVTIREFISPTILSRLQADADLVQATIPDWRCMVDCVLIDAMFDGAVFNVAVADIPEKKHDFVSGVYEFAAPEAVTTVAVKIIDMLGEEVVVTLTI